MCDPSGIGEHSIKPFIYPVLGTWHPFKQASIVLYRSMYHFTAPLFHFFNPGAGFYLTNNKLTKLTFWLSLIRLSFPLWKQEMKDLLDDQNFKFKSKHTRAAWVHLKNLELTVEYFIPLVHHYGCVIKTGTMDEVLTAQMRLISVFVACSKIDGQPSKHDYPSALAINVALLRNLRKRKHHPCFEFLRSDPMVMNEEQGELMFSVLARSMKDGNPIRSDVEKVSQRFVIAKQCMTMCKEMGAEWVSGDLAGDGKTENIGNTIKDQDVKVAAQHFSLMMRQMKAGQWRAVLTSEYKSKRSKKSKSGVSKSEFGAMLDSKSSETATLWDPTVSEDDLKKLEQTLVSHVVGRTTSWILQPNHGDMWDDLKVPLAIAPQPVSLAPAPSVAVLLSDDEKGGKASENGGARRRAKQKRKQKNQGSQKKGQTGKRRVDSAVIDTAPEVGEVDAAKPRRKKRRSRRRRSRSPSMMGIEEPGDSMRGDTQGDEQVKGCVYYPYRIRGEQERKNDSVMVYLIEWLGFPKRKDMTWEMASDYIGDEGHQQLVVDWNERKAALGVSDDWYPWDDRKDLE